MSKFFQLKSYFNHWLDVVDEHSIHSPYFYEFYNQVIKKDNPANKEFNAIEQIRQKLLSNPSEVTIHDLGASSFHFKTESRSISKVAATSLSPAAYCRLYNRIIHYTNASNILELGTSMGITTLYLALKKNVHVTTIEGNLSMINIATTNFEYFTKKNICLIKGNLDIKLSEYLLTPAKIDFALMDANHRYEPTLRYFNLLSRRMADKGVIVLDDIHHSEEMNRAWKELRYHQLVYGSTDLYRCGILFFDPALNRQHYTWSV